MSFEPGNDLSQETARETGGGADPWLCCRDCRTRVTREAWLVVRAGNAAHRFLNPMGQAFRLRCFGQAPGAVSIGEPSDVHTWFPGCCWQIALCAGCRGHLGWYYLGEAGTFWGLITDKLIVAE